MRTWNELPEEELEAGTFMTFKRYLEDGLEGYGPSAGKLDQLS